MDNTATGPADRYGTNGHRVILYAGTFEPYQGLDLLVKSASEVIRAYSSVRFLCAGGTEGQIQTMKFLAQQLGVAEYFVFPGTVRPEEVERLFSIASILVSPRVAGTNTPLKIYSYLRSGLPIIATNIASHTQVLSEDVALLVEPRADALGKGLVRLLEDAALAKRLAANAIRLAERSYSPDSYRRKVAEVISFLADRAQRPS